VKIFYIKRVKYYYYDTYGSWDEAYRIAKYYKKKMKNKFYIKKTEVGWFAPYFLYELYLTKVMRLGLW